MTDKLDNIVDLHERITVTVTFSPEATKLIKAEMEWWLKEYGIAKTAEELVEEATCQNCGAFAINHPETGEQRDGP
jgi:hypothetical protein